MTNKAIALFLTLFVSAFSLPAATFYVDANATGSKNGTSWTNAWTALSQITGVGAGDTVYISGGNYTLPSGGWAPSAGTYQIGQDAGHNGTATFTGSGSFLKGGFNGVTVSGDAGDGKQHFQVGNLGSVPAIDCSNTTRLTVSYVNFGQKPKAFLSANPGSGIQVDHCYFYKLTSSDNSVIWMQMPTNAPANNTKFFKNELFAPYDSTRDGFGDDVVGAADYAGFSFYNNSVIAYPITNYASGQHMDGAQPLRGSFLKFYNNYFQDITNYAVYGDAVHGGFTDFYVFNNVIVLVSSKVQSMSAPQGIAIGSETNSAPFKNVVVSNNLIADYTQHNAANVGDGGSGTISFQGNNGLWNNIATFSTANPVFRGNPPDKVSNINNVNVTSASPFVRYQQNHGDTADFHLVSGAASLIGKGTNLSSNAAACPEIVFDRDGNKRPASGAWDIGPYQYVSGGGPTPTPGPSVTPTPSATPMPSPTPSTKFKAGDSVSVNTDPASVRETPAGLVTGSQPMGTIGTVINGPTWMPADPGVLDNVATWWWEVRFPLEPHGWLGEIVLDKAGSSTPTPAPTPSPPPSGATYDKWIQKQNDWTKANPPTPDK
jgi:hypothetical protein